MAGAYLQSITSGYSNWYYIFGIPYCCNYNREIKEIISL